MIHLLRKDCFQGGQQLCNFILPTAKLSETHSTKNLIAKYQI